MRTSHFILLFGLAIATAAFSQSVTMPLWPGTPPGTPNVPAGEHEHDTTKTNDNLIAGKRVARIGDVAKPTLAFYPAPSGKNTGAAVVVFPGGAYQIIAYDLEGTEVCDWLNSIGVNCALVKYRVPNTGPFPKYTQDLADAQRAVRIVRQHASEWQLDANRVGVLGFSAGGDLVAVLGAHATDAIYPAIDDADKLSARPDFTLLIYPGYLESEDTQTVRPEVKPVALTPPSFLIQAEDDPVKVENAWVYYEALKAGARSGGDAPLREWRARLRAAAHQTPGHPLAGSGGHLAAYARHHNALTPAVTGSPFLLSYT